jgi:putative transcriptional regulator
MAMTRHPDDSTLLSYAAGSLPGALAVVVAAHVAVCPRCRDEVAMMELMGGALLAGLPGVALRRTAPERPEVEPRRPVAPAPPVSAEVPAPLAQLVGVDLDALRWRWIGPGLWVRRVQIAGEGRLHLIKGAPGATVPDHGHYGSELTMVLRGAITDQSGNYGPGDVCDLDEEVEHKPVAGAEGCICVVAQERPVRWRSQLARLMRPWHGI